MKITTEDSIKLSRFYVLKSQSIDWLIEYKNILTYSILGLIILFFLAFQFMSKFQGKAEREFIKANFSFQQWLKSPASDLEMLNILQKTLTVHPELHPKFDGLIAERLLNRENMDKADPFLVPMFKRVGEVCPYHARFARASVLIAKEQWDKALNEAEKLKAEMETDSSFWENQEKFSRFGFVLYAYNLLRIALLNKNLSLVKGELSAWEEIEKSAGWGQEGLASQFADEEAYRLLEKTSRWNQYPFQILYNTAKISFPNV